LKVRKFVADINALRLEGHLVTPLKGIFAGDQVENTCYSVANITEAEAIELIKKTTMSVGLYFSPNGSCKVIDLCE
jgi:hypothetical protein